METGSQSGKNRERERIHSSLTHKDGEERGWSLLIYGNGYLKCCLKKVIAHKVPENVNSLEVWLRRTNAACQSFNVIE